MEVTATVIDRKIGATIIKYEGSFTVHTYVASILGTSAHIIEGPEHLLIVDSQFLLPYALDFKKYIDSLNKPIQYMFISHSHPDHYLGLAAFPDVKAKALKETVREINDKGSELLEAQKEVWSEKMPTDIVLPQAFNLGTKNAMTIHLDGLDIHLRKYLKSKSEVQLTFYVPALKLHIIQELGYNNHHLFLNKDMNHWADILRLLLDKDVIDIYLLGHGLPATAQVLVDNILYLEFANKLYKTKDMTSDKFKIALLDEYPQMEGKELIDIYLLQLFIEG